MKNLKKLQVAVTFLNGIELTSTLSDSQKWRIGEINRLINEFIADNSRTPGKNEFDIWKFTSDDEYKPVMQGVFHDKETEYAVATDALIMVADKGYYDPSKSDPNSEGRRPIDKYGNFIDGRFPNWQSVLPKDTIGYKKFIVTLDELDEYIKKCNAYMKLNGLTGKYKKRAIYNIAGTDVWLDAERLRKFVVASGGEVYVSEPKRPAIYMSDDRALLLIPVLYREECNVGGGIYIYYK